jgi:putative copper export protein
MLRVLQPLSSVAIFAGVLLMIGSVAMRWRVLPQDDHGAGRVAAARSGARAGVLLCLGVLGAFLAQLLAFNLPPDPLLPDAYALLQLPWGRAWSVQAVLAAVATVVFLTFRVGDSKTRDAIALPLVAASAFTLAFTGHAASEEPVPLSVLADGIHVLASGVWVGTLAVVLATTHEAEVFLARIRRFSPMALVAAPVVAATGLTSAWLRLSHVSDLWLTGYGRWLSIKVALFLGVLALGYFNWRVGTRHLAASKDATAMRATVRTELLLALAVLLATAFLLSTPLPEGG